MVEEAEGMTEEGLVVLCREVYENLGRDDRHFRNSRTHNNNTHLVADIRGQAG